MTDQTPASLCFIDTETTGLDPERRVWELAMIRRDFFATGEVEETEVVVMVSDVDLSTADPMALKVGGFYDRYGHYPADAEVLRGDAFTNNGKPLGVVTEIHTPEVPREDRPFWLTEELTARVVEKWTRGAHLVGVVPSFDADCLDRMLRRHRILPAWHYHLIDVEAMAIGYLHGLARFDGHECVTGLKTWSSETALGLPELPWRSDEVSRTCGVEPPTDEDRHTALGDARWARRWYDALTGGVA